MESINPLCVKLYAELKSVADFFGGIRPAISNCQKYKVPCHCKELKEGKKILLKKLRTAYHFISQQKEPATLANVTSPVVNKSTDSIALPERKVNG